MQTPDTLTLPSAERVRDPATQAVVADLFRALQENHTYIHRDLSNITISDAVDHNLLKNTHNLTTDINHNAIRNTHNLTTDIDHDAITNTHNLTSDIDHDLLTGYVAQEHYDHSTISILTAGILSGGGTITSDQTIFLSSGDVDHDATANVHQDVNTTASPTFVSVVLTSNIDMSSNTQHFYYLPPNRSTAVLFVEGATTYMNFNTGTGSERVTVKQVLDLDANLDMSTGAYDLLVKDNQPEAWQVMQGANPYITVVTTNDNESITFGEDVIGTKDIRAAEFIKTGWPTTPGVTLSFDEGTRIFTVTDGGSAVYYIKGVEYVLGGNKTVTIDDTEGLWYIYFSGSTLTASQTLWVFTDDDKALVGYVHWDATNNKRQFLGYELHDYIMDSATHSRMHHGGGAAWESGLLVSDAGSETVNVSSGIILDEDIPISITDGAGSGLFEQVLSPAELPIWYRDGATDWRIYETTDKANLTDTGYVDGSNDLHYNKLNGTWASTAAGVGKYVAHFAIGANETTEPVSLIMGQRIDTTLATAKENNIFSGLSLAGLPFEEMVILARIIVKVTAGAPYYSIEDIQDLRAFNAEGNVVSPLITDHGGLGGLGDDDHAQYLLLAGRDGDSVNLYEDITWLGGSGENQGKFPDNLANAFSFQEGSNLFQTFVTTNGAERVEFGEPVGVGGWFTTAQVANSVGTCMQLVGDGTTCNLGIFAVSNSPADVPGIKIFRARGSVGSETNLLSGDTVFAIAGYGYADIISDYNIVSILGVTATGDFNSAADTPTETTLYSHSTTSILTGLTIKNDGDVWIGGNYLGGSNNRSVLWGSTGQASAKYDGTNFVINPKEVGTGYLQVLGNIESYGVDPKIIITDPGDGNSAFWTRTDTAGKMRMVNKCLSKGALGNALDHDAVDDRVNLGDTGDLDFGTVDWSVAAWVKTSMTNSTSIVAKRPIGAAGAVNGFSIHLQGTTGKVVAQITNDDGDFTNFVSTLVVNDNAWHRLVVTFDRDGNVTVVVDDGTPETSSISAVSNSINNAEDAFIRKFNATVAPVYGDAIIIDEVIFWNKVLSGAEITADYAGGAGKYYVGTENGFVEGYHLDESSGTDAASITGNNDGTLEGTMTDADWVTGKVTIADEDIETDALSSEDSVTVGERGIVKLGDSLGSARLLGRLSMPDIKTGATQAAASAVTGEPWATNGHATLENGVIIIGQ